MFASSTLLITFEAKIEATLTSIFTPHFPDTVGAQQFNVSQLIRDLTVLTIYFL